jgi:hypothetical protein
MLSRIDPPGDQYNLSVRKFPNAHFETSSNLACAFRGGFSQLRVRRRASC